MADDDKNIGSGGSGDGADDPWAGLDSDAATTGGDSFEFPGFESLLDESADDGPAVDDGAKGFAPEFAPTAAESPTDADAASVPAFDALSLGAQDGVFTDESAWNAGDPFAAAESDSANAAESPLAVFPPADAGLPADERGSRDEDHGLREGGQWHGEGEDADALAHLEDAADSGVDPGIVAFAQPDSDLPPSIAEPWESAEPGESLVVGEAGPGEGESLVGEPQEGVSAIQIGTGQSGILSFEDWGDAADATSTDVLAVSSDDESPFTGPAFDTAADAVQPDGGFGDAGGLAAAAGGLAAAAGGLAAATGAAAPTVRRVIKRRSGGGGVAAVVSVLLGGALAIPIAFAILLWGFKKDPFQIAPKMPASLAFLLPPEFQVAGQGGRTSSQVAVRPEVVAASRSLDDLVADAGGSEDAGASQPGGASRQADEPRQANEATDEPDAVDVGSKVVASTPKPAEPRRPPSLDTSALDAAVSSADMVTSRLLDASEQDPEYKRLLKDWYTAISKVGAEVVAIEQEASGSGAEFVVVSPALRRTIGRILADDRTSAQFAKLSRMWLKSRGRTSDGVVLPAVLGGTRKVGAWWVSRARVSDDPAVPEVAVLSRSRPEASEGDAIVVLGLVFEPGVVWAAVCERFEPVAAAENAPPEEPKSPAPATEELFPLE